MAAATNNSQVGIAVFCGLAMIGLPFVGLTRVEPSAAAAGYCALNMALVPLILLVAISLEQLVTAAIARLMGDSVAFVSIGVGPVVAKRTIGRIAIGLRAVPIAGVNGIITTRAKGQRLRLGVAMLAGSCVLIPILAIVVSFAAPWNKLWATLATRVAVDTIIIGGVGFVAIVGGLGALGMLLRLAGFTNIDEPALLVRQQLGSVFEADAMLEKGAYLQAEACARRGLETFPGNVMLMSTLAAALSERDAPEAFAIVETLTKTEAPSGFRPLVLNLWAWQCYMSDNDELRGEADKASAEALTTNPNQPSFLDTRGHVLLWNGKHEEAEKLLVRAYALARRRSGRAASAAGMAMVCAARSRIDDAVMWLERARAEDMHPQLVARATAAVDPLHRR